MARLTNVGLLRRLTMLTLLLSAAVWVGQYALLLCDPVSPLTRSHGTEDTSCSDILQWFRTSLSLYSVQTVHSACGVTSNFTDAAFNLLAVGDIHLGHGGEGLNPLYQQYTTGVDAVVGNLESPLPDAENTTGVHTLKAGLGLDLVSLANVGLHEAGESAQHSTLRVLEGAGLRWLGVQVKEHEMAVIQGERVGFLAFCAVYRKCAADHTPYSPLRYTRAAATNAVSKLRERGVKTIVVMVAWGHEIGIFPDETILSVARHLAFLRVTLVLGYHPTAVQGHAYLGHTLVVFSLGKALSWQKAAPFCWSQDGVYMEEVGMCGRVHPRVRDILRARESQTRLYRITVNRDSKAIAHYITLQRPNTGSVYEAHNLTTWTLACSEHDIYCLTCGYL